MSKEGTWLFFCQRAFTKCCFPLWVCAKTTYKCLLSRLLLSEICTCIGKLGRNGVKEHFLTV